MIEFNLSFSDIRVIEYSRRSLLRPEKRMGQHCYCNLQHIGLMNEQIHRQFGGLYSTALTAGAYPN